MTSKNLQMYNDFQLVYNNLASNLAPGLTTQEISMYLTKAYHSLVSQLYQSYEKDEFSRQALSPLTSSKKITPSSEPMDKIVPEAVLFELTDDILYIVNESIEMSSNALKCFKNRRIKVIPITHDDFFSAYENPFRLNQTTALRLNISHEGKRFSEIVCKDSHIKNYSIRYLRKPLPIVLEELEEDEAIFNITAETECELDTIYFSDIVKLAAQLAYQDYKSI